MSKTKRTNYSSDDALQAVNKRIKKLHGEGKDADEIAAIVRRNSDHVKTVIATGEKSKTYFSWEDAGDQFVNGKQFFKPLKHAHATQNRH